MAKTQFTLLGFGEVVCTHRHLLGALGVTIHSLTFWVTAGALLHSVSILFFPVFPIGSAQSAVGFFPLWLLPDCIHLLCFTSSMPDHLLLLLHLYSMKTAVLLTPSSAWPSVSLSYLLLDLFSSYTPATLCHLLCSSVLLTPLQSDTCDKQMSSPVLTRSERLSH